MAILPRQHFPRIFEPGCSIGNLTTLLVDGRDEIIASDLVDAAVDHARARLADSDVNGKARFEKWSLRDRWPNESVDLIVLSEICFYLTAPELDDLLDYTCAPQCRRGPTCSALATCRHRLSDDRRRGPRPTEPSSRSTIHRPLRRRGRTYRDILPRRHSRLLRGRRRRTDQLTVVLHTSEGSSIDLKNQPDHYPSSPGSHRPARQDECPSQTSHPQPHGVCKLLSERGR